MHVLRDAESIDAAIRSCADPYMRQLIADRAEFVRQEVDASEGEYDDIGELLNFILVEPGDTLQAIDAEMDGTFLADHYGGRRFGDPAFVPCFESLEEHATFYDIEFIGATKGSPCRCWSPSAPASIPTCCSCAPTRHAVSEETARHEPRHCPTKRHLRVAFSCLEGRMTEPAMFADLVAQA